MNSDRAIELLEFYLAGELPDDDMAAIEAWLQKEPAATKLLSAATERVRQLDADLQSPSDADALATKIINALDVQTSPPVPSATRAPRPTRRRRVVSWSAGLAAAAVVLWAAIVWLPYKVSFLGLGPAAVAKNDVLSGSVLVHGDPTATVSGGSTVCVAGKTPAVIRLTDGSQATLEPATSAVLYGRTDGLRQLIDLKEGGGTFRVEKAKGDFRVVTKLGSVTALGTEFTVRIIPSKNSGESGMKIHGAMLAVAVLAGTVQVDLGGKSFVLPCGENRVFAAEQQAAQGPATQVMIQDFEKSTPQPTVWVVNIPNENASVQLSTDQPHDGKQCLKLHYHFLSEGNFQYLGIPNKVNIKAPIHKLRYWINGNDSKCSYGVQINDAKGETHQFSKNTGQCGLIDFKGWKEIVIDLDSNHETWGGDKNNKIDYPITSITLTVGQPTDNGKQLASESDLCFDALSVDSEKSVDETLGCQVAVVSPAYCSDVKGDTTVKLAAPGFKKLTVRCWKQGGEFGTDSTVATVDLDAKGNGSFTFPAEAYPHGPVTVTINGENGAVKDNCYLQLYNKGGVSWNEGMPKDPPAAQGMKLIFSDDFKGPLSISSTDTKATYYDHKPPNGWQDFSTLRFTSADKPNNPFSQVDSYLRIRASEKAQSSGLLSSLKNDASGITAKAPCYFECRFVGPNAIGTWPAFWLLSDYMTEQVKGKKVPCDELDIIEAYGGEGPGHPNAFDTYMICPHAWDQGDAGKAIEKKAFENIHNPIHMKKFGIPSTWYETLHTYGCKITETETVYYCDNIEVGRHATLPLSQKEPFFFLINLATGGGWPVDLSRYDGTADMYVDFVRVYQGRK